MLDVILTYVSVIFNYAEPFFLRLVVPHCRLLQGLHPFRRILEAIDTKNSTPETRSRAYIYAFLAFLCSLLKACHHLCRMGNDVTDLVESLGPG
jgi:hypothetical protein